MAASGYLSVQDDIGGRGTSGELPKALRCDGQGAVGRVGFGVNRTVLSLSDILAQGGFYPGGIASIIIKLECDRWDHATRSETGLGPSPD